MKPYIVYITADGETVTMPKAKLEQLIQEAYEQGKADSYKEAVYPVGIWTAQFPYISPDSTGVRPCTNPIIIT